MTVNLNALTLRIGGDHSGFSSTVRAVRGDVNRVNRALRSGATASDHLRNATNSLQRVFATGAVSINEAERVAGRLASQYGSTSSGSNRFAESINRARQVVKATIPEKEKLKQQFRDLRTAANQGAITNVEYQRSLAAVKRQMQSLNAEESGASQRQKDLNERTRRVKSTIASLTPETTRLATQIRELRQEYARGNVSAAQFRRANESLRASYQQARSAASSNTQTHREALGIVQRTTPATVRLAAQFRQLHSAHRAGAITSGQYRIALAALRRELNRLRNDSQETAGASRSLFNQFKAFIGVYAGFRAIRGALGITIAIEQATAQFEVFTGSAANAARIVRDLKKLDRDAPTFGFRELQNTTRTLLAYGVEQDRVIGITRQLTQISGGNADAMNRLAFAFAQTASKGRLMGEEVRQFVNAGFNPLQQIALDTGRSMNDLQNAMEGGQISANMVAQAMENATSAGGRFFGMNERISKTLGGSFSRLSNSIQMAAADLTTAMAPALVRVMDGTDRLVSVFRALGPVVTAFASSIASTASHFNVFSLGLNRSTLKIGAAIAAFSGFIIIVPKVVAGIVAISRAIRTLATSQAILTALTGPRGWLLVLGGAVAATGAVYGLEFAFKEADRAAALAAGNATEGLTDVSDVANHIESTLRRINSATSADTGKPGSANALLQQYEEQNRALVFGEKAVERRRFMLEGATKEEQRRLVMLQKQNEMLTKAKELERKAKEARTRQIEEKRRQLEDRQKELQQERERLQSVAARVIEQTYTPFERFTAELAQLNRLKLSGLLDDETFNRASRQQTRQFIEDTTIKLEIPPSIAKGSVEEFRLLAQRQNEAATKELQQHREAMAQRVAQTQAVKAARDIEQEQLAELEGIKEAIERLPVGEGV